MTEVNFTFRVETDLKKQFMNAAKRKDRKASLLLRDFMREYVADSASVSQQTGPKVSAKRPRKSAARPKQSPAKHA